MRGKRHRMGMSRPRVNKPISRQSTHAIASPEENIQDAELFMRTNQMSEQNATLMLEKFRLTRLFRRQFISDSKNSATVILNRYPRLQDMFEAVSFITTSLLPHFVSLIAWHFR